MTETKEISPRAVRTCISLQAVKGRTDDDLSYV